MIIFHADGVHIEVLYPLGRVLSRSNIATRFIAVRWLVAYVSSRFVLAQHVIIKKS